MTENFPSVEVTTDGDVLGSPTEPDAYHLDDEIDRNLGPLYIYIWQSERHDRLDELEDRITELRQQYTYATGIVYAEPLRGLVPLEPDQITAYAWLLQMCTEDELFEETEEAARMIYRMQKHLQ